MKILLLALSVMAFTHSNAHADTLFVPIDGDIQEYLDEASNGDTIQLADGVYSLTTDLDTLNKQLIIRGYVTENTTLDGNNLTRVMTMTGDIQLENLTVANGSSNVGGGLFISGIAKITNCVITNCTATDSGGAIRTAIGTSLDLDECTITDNHSEYGGGILIDIRPGGQLATINDCYFQGNTAGVNGGALYVFDDYATITNSTFRTNTAVERGGGAYVNNADFENCLFVTNSAGQKGGGIRVYRPDSDGGGIRNCTFEVNSASRGGGVHLQECEEDYYIENSTFDTNLADYGGGIELVGTSCRLYGVELRNNEASEAAGGVFNDTFADGYACLYVTAGTRFCGNTAPAARHYSGCLSTPVGDPFPCMLDDCDQDSDGDGVGDCDDVCPDSPEYDLDGNGSIDCNPIYNRTTSTPYISLRYALPDIGDDHEIVMGTNAVTGESGPIFLDAANVSFKLVDEFTIPEGMLLRTGPDTRFINEVPTASFQVAGQLVAPSADTINFQTFEVLGEGKFFQNESLVLVNETCTTSENGQMFLNGNILSDLVRTVDSGENRIAGDTNVFSDYDNGGVTIVQRGTLYIYGDLTNTGTLTGDVNNGLDGPEPGDGISIAGNYTIGESASLVMPDPVWWLRVGGDLDIRIDDPARFVMAEATIELTGLSPEPTQTLEAMSADRGAVDSGLAPDNYPIGSVRLRPGSTVEVVNDHDNADGNGCEVIYADQLVVPAGASLVTSGCPIYVRSAMIEGSVSNPDDIVIIEDAPACPTDINGDGIVNGVDLAQILGAWGTSTAAADINGDGTVNGTDLALILGDWGNTCSD